VRVTIDEAAAIYTRACVAWYGTKALRIVRQQVQVMQKRGDKSGVEASTKVALALEHMQAAADAQPTEVGAGSPRWMNQ
jgi:hypothetical protein